MTRRRVGCELKGTAAVCVCVFVRAHASIMEAKCSSKQRMRLFVALCMRAGQRS